MPDLSADLALAVSLADAGGALALDRFRAADLHVETKDDDSPVTDADRAAERLLRDRLTSERPEDAVLGEEEGGPGPGGRRWLLDPVDGTANYAAGKPAWSTFVALEVDGEVVAGAIAQPALGRRFRAARGLGAWEDDRRLRVSAVAPLAAATLHDDWRRTLTIQAADAGRGDVTPEDARAQAAGPPDPLAQAALPALAAAAGSVAATADEGFLLVARGDVELCAGIGGKPWDFAPLRILVEEAGGRFSDLDGEPSIESGHALVSNGLVHDAALAALRAR